MLASDGSELCEYLKQRPEPSPRFLVVLRGVAYRANRTLAHAPPEFRGEAVGKASPLVETRIDEAMCVNSATVSHDQVFKRIQAAIWKLSAIPKYMPGRL
jgi:hypothetical protein